MAECKWSALVSNAVESIGARTRAVAGENGQHLEARVASLPGLGCAVAVVLRRYTAV